MAPKHLSPGRETYQSENPNTLGIGPKGIKHWAEGHRALGTPLGARILLANGGNDPPDTLKTIQVQTASLRRAKREMRVFAFGMSCHQANKRFKFIAAAIAK